MSLYNNVSASLSAGGGLLSGNGSASSRISAAAADVSNKLGGGALAQMGASLAGGAAQSLVNKYVPPQVQSFVNTGDAAVHELMSGDWQGAAATVLGATMNAMTPRLSGLALQAAYWGRPTPLLGGLTPTAARAIYDQMRWQKLARKNLWLIEVSSALAGNFSQRFNMFATDVEYSPYIVSGNKRQLGGAVSDGVQGCEATELRLTTLDDDQGTIKRWFAMHHAQVVAQDGTVGVPSSYAIKFKVVHAFITQDSRRGGYEDIGLFRPANLDVSLSRREQAMEEIQMTFSQMDTFMPP